MKRAVVIAALLGALLGANPASAGGVLVGVGTVTGPTCDGIILVEGAGAGDHWVFSAQVALDKTSGPCALLVTVAAANGTWNPATGGCVGNPDLICIGPSGQGVTPGVPVSVCPTVIVTGCLNGSATVVRA